MATLRVAAFGLVFLAAAAIRTGEVSVAPGEIASAGPSGKAGAAATLAQLPLVFEENRGQAPGDARFVARGPGYVVSLGNTDAAIRLSSGGATFRLELVDGVPAPRISAGAQADGVSHYLIGTDPGKWRTNIPRFASVRYEQIYDGIDLVYYGNPRQLEHDFIVAPHADPKRIAMRFPGTDAVTLEPSGDLVLQAGGERVRLRKPFAYQDRAGARAEVAARFALDRRGEVAFELGDYDRSAPLVIDPVLSYSTYAGGAGTDYAFGIAVDGSGNAYISGVTDSADFPVTTGAVDTSYGGSTGVPPRGDAFVIKLAPSGALIYATYVGGSDLDMANAIAVDAAGSAYITGRTISTNFPITPGVVQTQWGNSPFSSFGDMFVTKLNPAGTALEYSTFLAGYSLTTGHGIAVDSAGNAVVVGQTAFEFRTTNPLVTQPTAGFTDAFVAKLTPTAGSLIYATLIGGSNNDDVARSVALDADGNAYVTGTTFSTNLAVTNAVQPTYGGGGDTFVAKVSPSGAKLYVTYHGGNDFDSDPAIAADAAGNAYVTGSTSSTNFPVTTGALRTTKAAFTDAYVTKFTASGGLAYSTYLGGAGFDNGQAIAVDGSGNAFVLGQTASSDFPVASPLQSAISAPGNNDLFLTQLNAGGAAILFSTYFGGTGSEEPGAIALDGAGNVYITGRTQSTDFPTLNPFQAARNANSDAFIARIRTNVPTMTLDRTALTFAAVTSGSSALSTTGAQAVRLTQAGSGPVTWTAVSSLPWLTVSPSSGSGSATLSVTIPPSASLPAPGAHNATVMLTYTGASAAGGSIAVSLNILTTGTSAAPHGSFDTPLEGATGITGSIAVTGWAMDDVEVTRVRILRDTVAGEPAGQLVFIGDAVLVDGARPDVQASFPTLPRASRAGWGYLLLTNFLPGLGNGTYRLHAFADDADGHSTLLGIRTITCSNSTATTPFGAIDTPGQGETVSGTINNFGWVLSPGTRRADPPSGGAVQVVIDGAIGAAPGGWVARSDLTSLFPAAQFSGVGNALGVLGIDTTLLTNGVHTISWLVTDNMGGAAGIGSRYFTVSNGSGLHAAPSSGLTLERVAFGSRLEGPRDVHASSITGRRGFDLDAPYQAYAAGDDGRITIQSEELDRIELQLDGSEGLPPGALAKRGGRRVGGSRVEGALRVGSRFEPLPVGSRIDPATGTFTWQPGPGFVGSYDFVFATAGSRRDVRIVLNPKGSGRIGPQTVIDIAAGGVIAGWAADLDAASGTGVDTLHVWAYPAEGGSPIFAGVADYGSARPDVAAIYGERFLHSGYGLRVQGLPPGTYDLAVFAFSTVRGTFVPAKVVRVILKQG